MSLFDGGPFQDLECLVDNRAFQMGNEFNERQSVASTLTVDNGFPVLQFISSDLCIIPETKITRAPTLFTTAPTANPTSLTSVPTITPTEIPTEIPTFTPTFDPTQPPSNNDIVNTYT